MILKGRAEYETLAKDDAMLERVPVSRIESLPAPRVINTHFLLDRLPENILETGCKLVIVLRNPKDVAVSLYSFMTNNESYHYDGEWQDFLPMFLSEICEYMYIYVWKKIM